jgi:soluble lytic murein transglycosylase-like protein
MNTELIALAKSIALAHGLDPALVCAVIEQESAWNPLATRYEPEFYARYISPMLADHPMTPTEARSRAFSWGLMQVMGQTARENGYDGVLLSGLCEPRKGIEIGCTVLPHKLALHPGDIGKGLLAWNGGSNENYDAEVLARVSKYQ